jgi:hypothetical protein
MADTAPPCARCGTTGGPGKEGQHTPHRTDGRPLGVDGPLCRRCYDQIRYAAQRPPGPCAACGDPAGKARRRATLPGRFDGRSRGIAGKICHACLDRLPILYDNATDDAVEEAEVRATIAAIEAESARRRDRLAASEEHRRNQSGAAAAEARRLVRIEREARLRGPGE